MPVGRTGIVVVPDDGEGVAGAVGFPDEDGAVVHDEAEAGEVGCEAVVGVCAEGAGGVGGLGCDAVVAEEFDGQFFEWSFGAFPKGAVEFVIHGTFVDA
ncbi:MAG: hypothetical protein IJ971_11245 [Bacteroidales bacterium]|nr:hypothetical protein [Bacteroidales bacterium]